MNRGHSSEPGSRPNSSQNVSRTHQDRPGEHHHDESNAQPGILSGLTDEHGAPVRSDLVTGTDSG